MTTRSLSALSAGRERSIISFFLTLLQPRAPRERKAPGKYTPRTCHAGRQAGARSRLSLSLSAPRPTTLRRDDTHARTRREEVRICILYILLYLLYTRTSARETTSALSYIIQAVDYSSRRRRSGRTTTAAAAVAVCLYICIYIWRFRRRQSSTG